jgi:DNA repair exonuclease SbcCD ATPase subunit
LTFAPHAEAYRAAEQILELPALPSSLSPSGTLPRWEQALAEGARRTKLAGEHSQLVAALARYSRLAGALKVRLAYEAALAHYAVARAAHETWEAEKAAKVARLAELAGVDAQLAAIHVRMSRCVAYDISASSHASAKTRFDTIVLAITTKEAEADEYRKARSGLQILKSKIKQHLVPSLNRVASTLLSQMTGGGRSVVRVDDDFDVTVDGQPLNTLEGSGKAIANLAIRIGLGQVLATKVFSVFLGDEIDAAMDEDRAGSTAQCLRNLTRHVARSSS